MLTFDAKTRDDLYGDVVRAIAAFEASVGAGHEPVAPKPDAAALAELLASFDFARPRPPREALAAVIEGLTRHQVHAPHPRYFGLFNPSPTTMGVLGDALSAAFNPQLATASHSPFAVAAEAHLVRTIGALFGYAPCDVDGTFTSGGAEANSTAVLTALTRACPAFARGGARALAGDPRLYVSEEAHASFHKAARMCGLGDSAVSVVPADHALRMKPDALRNAIAKDKASGAFPFLAVATVGTTSAGVVDPVARLADVASRAGIALHVDAAWGGLAAFVPELASLLLDGCARADSITFDAHKALSVPMAAGMFLTRHAGALAAAFGPAKRASYMPRDASRDPYARSMQWSRRFIGLKVLLSLATFGLDGYASSLRHQVSMGALLRSRLKADGWEICNDSALPVVCFTDGTRSDGRKTAYLNAVVRHLVSSGCAWISMTRVAGGARFLRACVTNHQTGPCDIDALAVALIEARGASASTL
jgi:aromatic-L-amino-acid/L-tryptophan decarboxylase